MISFGRLCSRFKWSCCTTQDCIRLLHINLDFVVELSLFSHCFNLKDLSLNKRFECLRKLGLIVYLTKCMVFTLLDHKQHLKKLAFIFKIEQSHT